MSIEIHLKDEYILAGHTFTIDEENKQKLKTLILDFIHYLTEIEPGLDINSLKNLYVPNDYSKEVIDFQRRHKLTEGITDNKIAKGYGISLSYKDEVRNNVTSIFISPEIILPPFTSKMELEDQIPLFNVIYHELCHIDDYNKQSKLSFLAQIKQKNVMDKLLYVLSLEVWEEYYAHRRSSKVFPFIYFDASNFQLILQEFKVQTVNLIKEYQIDGDLDYFVEQFYYLTGAFFYR